MKRIGNIYDKICTIDNLYTAYLNARKGKKNTYGVRVFEKDIENNLLKLHSSLNSLTYKTSEYYNFKLNEYGKDRLISRLPFYPDRIVHHWLMMFLEPEWNKIFIRDTYACIKGRGIHDGLYRLKKNLLDVENTFYCLKIDVRKFYPSIDHGILKTIVRRKVKDKKLLFILDEIIDSAPGVPIGNYLSQYFANLYLAYFDHYMKEIQMVEYYQRYADDIVILHHDKSYLHALLINISDYLEQNLHLSVKRNYQVFPVKSRGIDFLGYKSFHSHVLIRKSIKQRMFRKVKSITQNNFMLKTAAYNGWLKYANAFNLTNKYRAMVAKRFSELGVHVGVESLTGEKIKISKILDKEIMVKAFKVTESKYDKDKHCLKIQIEISGENKVIFTGSEMLRKQIEQVGEADFPFQTVIKSVEETYQFT